MLDLGVGRRFGCVLLFYHSFQSSVSMDTPVLFNFACKPFNVEPFGLPVAPKVSDSSVIFIQLRLKLGG